jgi:hypothetical protein
MLELNRLDGHERTTSYMGTIFYDNPDDMRELKNLRETMKDTNKVFRKHGLEQFRIVVQNRFGANNPNTKKYNLRTNYRVKAEDATYADVYMLRR